MINKILWISILSVILFSACRNNNVTGEAEQKRGESRFVLPEVAVIKETFLTLQDQNDNVDSPALWHGDNGQNWLLATAKKGNVVIIYDAATGELIRRFGKTGSGIGELSRPNGIAVTGNLVVIAERDNHRIQVFTLPDLQPLGVFGENDLRFPYGISIGKVEGKYHLYVTDNYESPDEETPPADSLGKRIHKYEFTVDGNHLVARHIMAFGDTSGDGVLYKVESILIDQEYNRLLISDEHEEHCNVKIYDADGRFTGQVIPHNYFFYEPEGIILWECESDSSGYYIIVDQGIRSNTFQVFNRKTLEYIGGFSGEITRNTDGIAITQKSFGEFKSGAFYPVHNDGSLAAISWEDIATTLGLRDDCN